MMEPSSHNLLGSILVEKNMDQTAKRCIFMESYHSKILRHLSSSVIWTQIMLKKAQSSLKSILQKGAARQKTWKFWRSVFWTLIGIWAKWKTFLWKIMGIQWTILKTVLHSITMKWIYALLLVHVRYMPLRQESPRLREWILRKWKCKHKPAV